MTSAISLLVLCMIVLIPLSIATIIKSDTLLKEKDDFDTWLDSREK